MRKQFGFEAIVILQKADEVLIYKRPTATRCICCNEIIWDAGEKHEGIQFINGYPERCKYWGVTPYEDVGEVWQYANVETIIISGNNFSPLSK